MKAVCGSMPARALRRAPGPLATAPAFAAIVPFAAFAVLFGGACARTAEERHLDDMREEIERIQLDRDRANQDALRTDPLEGRGAGAPAPQASGVGDGVTAPAQAPVVVGQAADTYGYEEVPDTDDKTPRPSIRVFGWSRNGGRSAARGEDQVQQTVPDDGDAQRAQSTPASPRPSALDPEAKRAYDAALSLVNARQYDKALDALAAFLLKWPDHPYADNAMYWRGECYFARAEYLRASEQFEGVVTRFPAGNKVPDALLKLGICHQKLGNPTNAKAWFDRLSQQFPRSDAARRIPAVTVPAATPPGPASEDHR
jgi:tol-pal system protein YbgF